MQLIKSTLTITFIILTTLTTFSQSNTESNFALGLSTGYNRGFGINIHATALQPLQSIPIQLRAGFGYTNLNPGSATDARRIFINNATNGVPEEKAKTFDYRLDFLWPTSFLNLEETYWVVGPRYCSFTANFKFIGGNEDFDVTSKQFGIGIGSESRFKISSRINLVAALGLDYFFDNTLTGHDTSYSPDDDNVNPREDNQNNNTLFTYSDADDAIKQPDFMPRVLIGVLYKL